MELFCLESLMFEILDFLNIFFKSTKFLQPPPPCFFSLGRVLCELVAVLLIVCDASLSVTAGVIKLLANLCARFRSCRVLFSTSGLPAGERGTPPPPHPTLDDSHDYRRGYLHNSWSPLVTHFLGDTPL